MSTEIKDSEVVPSETPKKPKSKGNGKPVEDAAIVPRGDVDMLMVEAVRSGNVEVMAQVMEIRRELKAEAAKEAFFDSFAAFQAECPVIKKTKWVKSSAGSPLYSYAPLDSIVKQVGGLISKHGFSYTIKAKMEPASDFDPFGRVLAACRVQHIAGHTEESYFSIGIKEGTSFTNSAQQAGASLTYAKRYAFCAAFGIVTEDDDTDGRILPEDARKARQPVSQPRPKPSAQNSAQRANGAPRERVQLEPAEEGEGIDKKVADGIWRAMEHGQISMQDFTKRFPKLTRLGEIRKGDERVVLSWLADPANS